MQTYQHCFMRISPSQDTVDPLGTSSCLQDKYQMDLVTQYLDLNECYTPIRTEPVIGNISYTFNELPPSNTGLSFIKQKIKEKNGSLFHNFQKHIIITLKNSIKIKKNCIIDGSKCTLSSQLWEYVTSSSKSSKKWFLDVLCSNLQENCQLKNDPRWKDVHERVLEAGERKVKAAQDHLRMDVVKQAYLILERKQLRGRRIQRLQEFELYFREFMSYLEKGGVYRRLPKLKRQEIEQKRGQCNLIS